MVLIVTQGPGGRFPPRQRDFVERLERALLSDGIVTLNSLRELERRSVDNGSYRFEHDGHWNRAAHAVVGRALAIQQAGASGGS